MRSLVSSFLVAAMLLALAPSARAAVDVSRSGAENPMVEVARSTIYGGLTGLVLGSAVALANDGKNGASIVRWGFVAGTFFGFAYGLYHVQSRPQPRALLEIRDGEAKLATPEVALTPGPGLRVALVSAKF